jgi:predicted glycoside hydrolase/deacetylase ChbG (UPF0249 family)
MKRVSLNNRTIVFFGLIILMIAVTNHARSEEIRLIVRGDDMGMTHGSLVAFEEAFKNGVLTCASMQVCAPWFEATTKLCSKNPNWCVGVHLTLIGEWLGYRWRPVLPWSKVSSLVDEDGFLFRYPDELWANKPRIGEIDAEFRAQINLAVKKGVKVQYIDTHYMGYSSYPGLEKIIKTIGSDYNLPISGLMGERYLRGVYKVPVGQKKETALRMLEDLGPGLWLWGNHLGIDSPEQNALVHTKAEDFSVEGGVGKHRAEETKVLISPEVKSMILEKGIKLTNYKELWLEIMKQKSR